MRNNQLSIHITQKQEQLLFDYITNDCNCKIYCLNTSDDGVFKRGQTISDFCYFIKPNLITNKVKYKKSEDKSNMLELAPFDANMNFMPFILYERNNALDINNFFSRLYVSKNVKKEYMPLLECTYKKIMEWIINNSYRYEKYGSQKIYYLDKTQVPDSSVTIED